MLRGQAALLVPSPKPAISKPTALLNTQTIGISAALAHARLGDVSIDTLLKMKNHGTSGLSIRPDPSEFKCKVCVEANMKHVPIPRMRTRSLRPMQVLGCDLQEIEVAAHGGEKYLAIYADHATGCMATRALKRKSDQPAVGVQVVKRFEVISGKNLDTLRADQGGEYTAKSFVEPLLAAGIKIEYSDTDQAFQNGLAEVLGGKIVAMMRAARVRSGLPKMYWTENAAHQTWIHNRVSLKRQDGKTTPIEELTGERADLSRARVFGCEAWVLIRRRKKEKLEPRAERAVHLGVSQDKKAWKLLLWQSRRIIESRNVYFFEEHFPFKNVDSETADQRRIKALNHEAHHEDDAHGEDREMGDVSADDEQPHQGGDSEQDGDSDDDDGPTDQGGGMGGGMGGVVGSARQGHQSSQVENDVSRRSTRLSFRPNRFSEIDYDGMSRLAKGAAKDEKDNENDEAYNDVITDVANEALLALMTTSQESNAGDSGEPLNEKEAAKRPEWLKAEDEEYQGLIEKHVFDIVNRPSNAPVLPTRMVYKVKQDQHGCIERRKARFVVKGCCDPWKNLKETFAPTLNYTSMRLILCLSAMKNCKIHQLDVTQAFLNSKITDAIFVEQPINQAKGDPRTKVLKLNKALYGLVEAPKLWHDTLITYLKSIKFKQLIGDPCVFVRKTRIDGLEQLVMIGVFVDDFLIFSTSEELTIKAKQELATKFEVKDLGEAVWILGMKLTQGKEEYTVDQSKYLSNILNKYKDQMNSSRLMRTSSTPLPTGKGLEATKDDEMTTDAPYREVIGSLAYLMMGTRPDIAYAVSTLSRHLSRPAQRHWDAAMHVMKYLEGTRTVGISYRVGEKTKGFQKNLLDKRTTSEPTAAVDSDFGNDKEESKSISGYLVTVNESVISWRSKRQSMVATSTCHAEYVAASEASREVIWIRMLLQGIGFTIGHPSIIFEDNAAAQQMLANNAINDRNKHIRVKYHYVRECVQTGDIIFKRVKSKRNPADALTKATAREAVKNLLSTANMKDVQDTSCRVGRLLDSSGLDGESNSSIGRTR